MFLRGRLCRPRRALEEPRELVCAENRREYYAGKETEVPTALKPDFWAPVLSRQATWIAHTAKRTGRPAAHTLERRTTQLVNGEHCRRAEATHDLSN